MILNLVSPTYSFLHTTHLLPLCLYYLLAAPALSLARSLALSLFLWCASSYHVSSTASVFDPCFVSLVPASFCVSITSFTSWRWRQKHINTKSKHHQVRDFNEARKELRAIAAEQTKQQDLVLLDYAIQKDKAGEAEEQAKREEEKRVRRVLTKHVYLT